jgi:hypothetical protein
MKNDDANTKPAAEVNLPAGLMIASPSVLDEPR